MSMSSLRILTGGCGLIRSTFSKASRLLNSNVICRGQHIQIHQTTNQNVAFSTIPSNEPSVRATASLKSEEAIREFLAVFPDIMQDLTDNLTDTPEVAEHCRKVFQYNVQSVSKNGALALVQAYEMLEDPDKLTPENLRLSRIMGWCIQIMECSILVVDDILDSSEMRWGKRSWHKNPGVALSAINDAILIDQSIYAILRKHFSGHPCYLPVIELFHEVNMKTAIGQTLDMLSNTDSKPDFRRFNMERYNTCVKYKTAYGIYLQVALPMYMTGKFDSNSHREAKSVLMEMGQLFQVQDDYLDCFGDPRTTGKPSSDIKEGKGSWPIIVALQRATPKQREILETNYGRQEPEAIQTVRALYEELDLRNVYAKYTEENLNLIRTHIHQMSENLPRDVFLTFLSSLHRPCA